MNADRKCLKFEMPKMPKIAKNEKQHFFPLTLNAVRARGSAPLQTLNLPVMQMNPGRCGKI
jgi:hypothetical protein